MTSSMADSSDVNLILISCFKEKIKLLDIIKNIEKLKFYNYLDPGLIFSTTRVRVGLGTSNDICIAQNH